MILVGETLGIQEWDAAICVRGFHGKFCVNQLNSDEEGVHLVFFNMLMTSSTTSSTTDKVWDILDLMGSSSKYSI